MNLKEELIQLLYCYSTQKIQINENTKLREDLGIDSLSLFELSVAIEQRLDAYICAQELFKINTFKDLYTITESKIKND